MPDFAMHIRQMREIAAWEQRRKAGLTEYTVTVDPQSPRYLEQVAWLVDCADWWQADFSRQDGVASLSIHYAARQEMPKVEEKAGADSDNERDTKFAGFAELLAHDLLTIGFDGHGYRSGEDMRTMLARRLYDVAFFTLKQVDICGLHGYPARDRTVQSVLALDVSVDQVVWPEYKE